MFLNWLLTFVSLALIAIAASGSAQDYPNRALRLINPGTPGGSTDPVARLISQRLAEILG